MDCWNKPLLKVKDFLKIRTRKYCWIYPESDKPKLRKLKPNFDHCKTYYTKCDFKLEACVHEQILKVEDAYRVHSDLLVKELGLQLGLIERCWWLSQRFLILTTAGVCIKLYPEAVSVPTEQRILCEFHDNLRQIHRSNCRLGVSTDAIRELLKVLRTRYSKLDMSVESTYLKGNWYQPPLAYVSELVDDVFEYFYGVLCSLKRFAQLIDPGDAGAIEDYIALVKPSDDFKNYLMTSFESCRCMRLANPECIYPHVPCGLVHRP